MSALDDVKTRAEAATEAQNAYAMPAGLSPLTGSAGFYSDVEPLRRALKKIKTRDEDLTETEHLDLTKALEPFLVKFAELLHSLERAAAGAVRAIDWSGLVEAVRKDDLDGDVIPLESFTEVSEDEVDAWMLRGAAERLAERKLHLDLVTHLMVVADEIAPIEVVQ